LALVEIGYHSYV